MRLIKIPFNGGSLDETADQDSAPDKIVELLKRFSLDEDGRFFVINQEELLVDNSDLQETFHRVESLIAKENYLTLVLGGDHSLTYPCFRAFARKHVNPGIVVFDARAGVSEDLKVNNSDYLRALLNEHIVKGENVLLVGLRSWSKDEIAFLRKNNIKFYTMREISMEGKSEVCDSVMSVAREWDGFYLSVGVGVLDPAFAPGTSCLEPGGLTSRQLLYFIQRLKLLKNLKMVDVVEVCPSKDFNDITSLIAAKLISELA
ncbi:MAG: arginase family protein [Nanoarchaeota archaeon]|nr:arginase family protein [Nanoarchaeota archaeon]MBU1854811.1 arginase family protein [Nanoarchaeota archaeon]